MTFDALDRKSWSGDLFARLRELRERGGAVQWEPENEIWLALSHEAVTTASKAPELFSSSKGVRPRREHPLPMSILTMDDPRHRQLRNLVNKGFTPRRVSHLEDAFRTWTVSALDRTLESGDCFDFVAEIAVPLPLLLIAEMIGIEDERLTDFRRWSDDMMEGEAQDPATLPQASKAAVEYITYLQEILARRRETPRDDLVSVLLAASNRGDLSGSGATASELDVSDVHGDDELLQFLVTLLVAGNETTRNAISGGVAALIDFPDQYQRLRTDPSLIPLAADEVVRFVSPVMNFSRSVVSDCDLGGQQLKADQEVLLVYASANRDPDVFEEPDSFDVARTPNPHVGFGIGPHFCLGANLARMEIRIVLEELTRRVNALEYAEGPPRIEPNTLVRSYEAMTIRADIGD